MIQTKNKKHKLQKWKSRENRILRKSFKRHAQLEEIKFLVPHSKLSIRRKIVGLDLKTDKRKKMVADSFFDDARLSVGKIKWLGFLYHRAVIYGNVLSIHCHGSYQSVLEEMNRDLGSTYQITKYKKRNRICLRIRSKKICNALEKFGMTNKLGGRRFPRIPIKMDRFFLEGLKFKLKGDKRPIK